MSPLILVPAALYLICFHLLPYIHRSIKLSKWAKEAGCGKPFRLPFPFLVHRLRIIRAGKARRHVHYLVGYHEEYRRKTVAVSSSMLETNEPEIIKTILSTSFNNFVLGTRYPPFKPLLGAGVFTLDGEGWKHSREMLRPQFKRGEITAELLSSALKENVTKFLDIAAGNPEDLQGYCFKLTLDNATKFLFGKSTDSLSGGPDAAFERDFTVAQDWVLNRARYGYLRDVLTPKHAWDAMRRCREFVEKFVDEELARRKESGGAPHPDGRYVFLRALAAETQDRIALRDQMLNIILAGRDTTAGLLGWSIFSFARHPEVYQKLRKECEEVFGQGEGQPWRQPTFEELKNIRYLQFVLNEVLRLYPSVPLNGRTCVKDTLLPCGGGPDEKQPLLCKKGTIVNYSVYSMHRRKDLWGEDAEEFRPERWEGRKPGWDYLPFNGGPRVCLGQQYALTEGGYIILRILERFSKIEVAGKGIEGNEGYDGKEVEMQASLTMAPRAVRVKFTEA